MALSRTYRLLTIVEPLDAEGNVIPAAITPRKVWIAREGRDDLVVADLNPVGQWVVNNVTALEAQGSDSTDL